MTRYTSTASKRTRTIAQLLTVVMTAAVIVAITACQGEQPPPTHRPQTEDRSPIQTMEAMALDIAALQTKAAEPAETAEDDREERVEPSATAIWTATEEPSAAPTPAKAVIPTPASPDICGRSPTLQKEILMTLRSPSCSIINEAELFRIQCFTDRYGECKEPQWDWGESGPRPGDFAGLVNLKELEITGSFTIQPGTFSGSGITHLKLKAKGIEQGAFDGAHIEDMTLDTAEMPPKGTLPRSLRSLRMTFKAPEQVMERDELKELVNLEHLNLSMYRYDGHEELAKALSEERPGEHPDEVETEFNLPTGMLEGNSKLKSVGLSGAKLWGTGSGANVSVDNALVAGLEELESISIGNLKTRNHLSGDPPLILHTSSPLHQFLNNPNVSEWDDSKQRWENWNYGERLSAHTQK